MEKVKKAITVYVSGNKCNLNCSYCYVNNACEGDEKEQVKIKYDLNTMIEAFLPKRLGGIADITVIGSAETLLVEEVIPFIHGLLHQGHVVTVVTNATLTKRIDLLLDTIIDDLSNLIIKASLHWIELKKRNLIHVYFNNLKKIIASGASCYPFVIISNEYIPYLKEISDACKKNLGFYPYCSPCNEVVDKSSIDWKSKFSPECTPTLIEKVDSFFDTRIFHEIIKNREINTQEYFCYAGVWSFGVDFATGRMMKCHGIGINDMNFYEEVGTPIILDEPVACSCGIESCCLQYNFFAEGLLPEYRCETLYGDMIYKEGLVSSHIRDKLNVRFSDIFNRLSLQEETRFIIKNKNKQIEKLILEKMENPFLNKNIHKKIKEGKKIVIYGSGENYNKYKDTIWFPVEFFLDSFCEDNNRIDGKLVFRPEIIQCFENYFIIISTKDKKDIENKLNMLGLKKGENYI